MYYIRLRSKAHPEMGCGYVSLERDYVANKGNYENYEIEEFSYATSFDPDSKLIDEVMDMVVMNNINNKDCIIDIMPDPFLKTFDELVEL